MNPAELQLALQAFLLLEPEVQRGIIELVHLIDRKPKTAADYIAEAQTVIAKAAATPTPAPPPTT
jgi:hypothetical protein